MKCAKMKKLRQDKGYTQEELGNKLGVTGDYINMIENGRRTPSFKLAKNIADLFEVTVDELFFYE